MTSWTCWYVSPGLGPGIVDYVRDSNLSLKSYSMFRFRRSSVWERRLSLSKISETLCFICPLLDTCYNFVM